jgi:hypothetical protein
MQLLLLTQAVGHVPPQSTSVSPPSFTPSLQCVAVQLPLPSQTWLLPSHAMPFWASVAPHVWAAVSHLGVAHTVPEAGQSLSMSQATQAPWPSQTFPLLVHAVPEAASVTLHEPETQATVAHAVPVGVQSPSLRHVTQLPMPSHSVPPPSVHLVPAVA